MNPAFSTTTCLLHDLQTLMHRAQVVFWASTH